MRARTKSMLPPGPKESIPMQHFFSFRKDKLQFLKKITEEYGDIVYFSIGPTRVAVLNHPDLIRDVLTTHQDKFIKGRPLQLGKQIIGNGLLTSEGAFHKCQSRIMQPAFHRRMIDSYFAEMKACVSFELDQWRDGMQMNVLDEMIHWSTIIAGKAFFNTDFRPIAQQINHALKQAMGVFERVAIPFSEVLFKLPIPGTIRFNKAKAYLDSIIYKLIRDRRKQPLASREDDLLTLLLRAQENQGCAHGMSDELIRDQALTILLTAFDTTSLSLTWTWYLLARHPEVASKMHKELDSILKDRIPELDEMDKLRFTRQVLQESLRMYPPVYLMPKQTIEDYEAGGYLIPKDTIVLISPYLIHHDPRFYRDPDTFDPHRWDDVEASAKMKYLYFPFSRGPRACIGESFAWLEGMLILAAVGRNFRLEHVPGHQVQILQQVNLRPRSGLRMTIHGRT